MFVPAPSTDTVRERTPLPPTKLVEFLRIFIKMQSFCKRPALSSVRFDAIFAGCLWERLRVCSYRDSVQIVPPFEIQILLIRRKARTSKRPGLFVRSVHRKWVAASLPAARVPLQRERFRRDLPQQAAPVPPQRAAPPPEREPGRRASGADPSNIHPSYPSHSAAGVFRRQADRAEYRRGSSRRQAS